MRHSISAAACLGFLLSACVSESKQDPNPNQPAPAESKTDQKTGGKPTSKPSAPALPAKTPAEFRVKFHLTCGDITVRCVRAWSPLGADRFFEMLKTGFFKDIGFFRVIPNFVAQFGIHGDPETAGEWSGMLIQDDPPGKKSNVRGTITFATRGPHTRTTQMFINFRDNTPLDRQGFTPFAEVVEGMDNVDKIFKIGQTPSQQMIKSRGNEYLKQFKDLDYIKSATYLGK